MEGSSAGSHGSENAHGATASSGKDMRNYIRVTAEQSAQIKARALAERKTITDYVIGRCLEGKPVELLPGDAVAAAIRRRGDIGKATGMLKHALAQGVRDGPQIMEIERAYRDCQQRLYDVIKLMAEALVKIIDSERN